MSIVPTLELSGQAERPSLPKPAWASRAGGLPVGGVRVDRQLFREGEHGRPDLRRGGGPALGLGSLELQIKAGGGVGLGAGQPRLCDGLEGLAIAVRDRRIGGLRMGEDAGPLVGLDVERGRHRRAADGGVVR